MIDVQMIDLIRLLHLAFFAAGLGAGMFAESRILGRYGQPITDQCIRNADSAHRFVALAVAGLWITGLALIAIRTGFDPGRFTPKLWTKLVVVSVLSANAALIATVAMPIYRRCVGLALHQLGTRRLIVLSVAAAISLASWFAALALGSSVFLKTAGWDVLGPLFAVFYAIVIAGAIGAAFAMSRGRVDTPVNERRLSAG